MKDFKDLNTNASILVTRADKVLSTVILNRTDYETKVSELLDEETYQKLYRDSISNISKIE